MVPELVDGERRRQAAVGIDLGEQLVCLLLDRRDRVGARDPAQRGVVSSTVRAFAEGKASRS